jgi:hypothetical protein
LRISPVRFSPHAETCEERGEGASSIALRPSPQFSLGNTEVRIIGQTGLCARRANATATSLAFTWRGQVDEQALGREDVRAFLDYVVLSAAGLDPGRAGHRSALFFRSSAGANVRVCAFAPLDRGRALAYLAVLCGELLALSGGTRGSGLHPYLLPHEAVLASRARGTRVRDEIENLCGDSNRAGFSSLRGPVPEVLARYAAPSDETAERMVNARFGLFFDLVLDAVEEAKP